MGLVKKLLAPAVVAGAVLLPNAVSAQQSSLLPKAVSAQQTSAQRPIFKPQTYFYFGFNSYRDKDEDVNKRYDAMLGGMFGVTQELSRNFRADAGVTINTDKADFTEQGYSGTSEMSVISFGADFSYVEPWKNNKGSIYYFAGLALTQVREEGTIAGYGGGSQSGQGISLNAGIGVDFRLNRGSMFFIKTEYFSLASEDVDLKGTRLGIGFRNILGGN